MFQENAANGGNPEDGLDVGKIQNGLVTVRLGDVADFARCPICMGIVKDTRTISVCMHRFCKSCIEAWLRSNIDNTCPQCRKSFASRRDCKPDPTFDQLLGAIFGDAGAADDAFLEAPADVLRAAGALGSELEGQREVQRAAARTAAMQAAAQARAAARHIVTHSDVGPGASSNSSESSEGYAVAPAPAPPPPVRRVGRPPKRPASAPAPGADDGGKRARRLSSDDVMEALSPDAIAELSLNNSKFMGVREYCGKWLAFTREGSGGGEATMLGQYGTEEEAARTADLHTYRIKGPAPHRLNFPHLAQAYSRLLSNGVVPAATSGEYEAARQKIAAAVKGIPVPSTWRPPRDRVARAGGTEAGISAAAATASAAVSGSAGGLDRGGGAGLSHNSPMAAGERSHEEEAAANRAAELAKKHPLALRKGAGTALVEVRPGPGVPANLAWKQRYLACPADATVGALAEAIAAGLMQQQQEAREGSGAVKLEETASEAVAAERVLLNASNELDATADFVAVYYDPDATGSFVLRKHLAVRELLLLLADCGEDLVLEYTLVA